MYLSGGGGGGQFCAEGRVVRREQVTGRHDVCGGAENVYMGWLSD